MKESNKAIQEDFLLLAERLKLDTRFWSKASGVKGLESELKTFLTQDSGEICVGPYMPDWSPLTLTPSPRGRGTGRGGRLSDRELESLAGVYKKLFLPRREIRFIGVDLDDCLYDVTPIRSLVSGEAEGLEARLMAPDSELKHLYKPYKGVKSTLKHLMGSGDFVVGILTNGPSRLQRDKINLLGLKEDGHFNFVMASEDVGIGKPSKEFFELARERASQLRNAECGMRNNSTVRNPKSEIRNEECLILEDKVKNISGADGWLKVQFLKGHHSNILPSDVKEIPKYGITDFSTLSILLNLEKDSEFQTMAASYFVLKSLLLLLSEIP